MNVALIGSGSWGTAVAGLAAARAERVTMWAHSEQTAAGINGEHRNPRYLVGYELPKNVVATTELAQALDGAEAIIFAVPSTHLRSVCHQAAPFIAADTPVLCLTKGIEPESGLLMSEVIASEIDNEARVAALSGPNHAEAGFRPPSSPARTSRWGRPLRTCSCPLPSESICRKT